jgi:hypothetical protein
VSALFHDGLVVGPFDVALSSTVRVADLVPSSFDAGALLGAVALLVVAVLLVAAAVVGAGGDNGAGASLLLV